MPTPPAPSPAYVAAIVPFDLQHPVSVSRVIPARVRQAGEVA